MLSHNLGYPRVGAHRELKKVSEAFWAGNGGKDALLETARKLRRQNWETQRAAGIDLIPSNDFSLYDQVLDAASMVGAIPKRFHALIDGKANREMDLYYAMARGVQREGIDLHALEMTKWFDTNYHYLVPEFSKNQSFTRYSNKVIHEFVEALQLGILTKPVLLGPISFLLLGKEKESGFHRIDLLDNLLPVYISILEELADRGATHIQLDEPMLVQELTQDEQVSFHKAYAEIRAAVPQVNLILATYFGELADNLALAAGLPINVLHIDITRSIHSLPAILSYETFVSSNKILSLGLVDGRNIWKNRFEASLSSIKQATRALGRERVWLAPSCSLLHCPYDLELEGQEDILTPEVKNWMAFSRQKLTEIAELKRLSAIKWKFDPIFLANRAAQGARNNSPLIHRPEVKAGVAAILPADLARQNTFSQRQLIQKHRLKLPLLPTTTIGSFPQTEEIRALRARFKNRAISEEDYHSELEKEIIASIRWQESLGMDVLVHGEFERNDMVEYFGERLSGFVFSQNGWVQSYGSRCVKPPIIYGDVSRPFPMTVRWSAFAQANTIRPMKGMLTGPVTILQWSFVRDDQPRQQTAWQIGLAIRQEVLDLEKAGIRIIQIDEPALREGLPLRKKDWAQYLEWAVGAFKLSASAVADQTQIHTHMCYSEFNDIIEAIANLDADVITIETSRSQMELLDAFVEYKYPNEIGPGVYDIHSPRTPSVDEMVLLLEKALRVIPARNLWVNPDCGLKTRKWPETKVALQNMVAAANLLREAVAFSEK
ncbi:5-methyltetrahydropteroyltriglutamate--homocysteine S-methyltransferase [Dyadobacter tibetensis]|uniref:5-methyltetrahydropteroyltriglutamate-- homocysteine S-methyltransferase n=1 Tax=Dyadobacter tibetensis TaxID=1211851 RepID=UPI000471EA82|nr:5-methyltetrahydropteroyltriglutamate--homocysteine S-methyltransferase [Dyadobacter tibetensis]